MEAAARVRAEIASLHDDKSKAVSWNLALPSLVVAPPLLPAPYAAHGLASIEERNRLVVLPLPILDHEVVPWIVSVHGQLSSRPFLARITQQPRKPMLTPGALAEYLIAQIDDIALIPHCPSYLLPSSRGDIVGAGNPARSSLTILIHYSRASSPASSR